MKTIFVAGWVGAVLMAPGAAGAQGTASAGHSPIVIDRIVAVVGKVAITRSQLYDRINDEIASREAQKMPPMEGDSTAILHRMLDDLIDTQLLLQKADEFKLVVQDEELTKPIDERIKRIRAQMSEADFQAALKEEGRGSIEEWRKFLIEQSRHEKLQRMVLDTLTKLGQMPTISVSEKDIKEAFDSVSKTLPARGPTVTFRQIVIKPVPSDSEETRAKHLADSLVTAIKAGASFDSLARRFSDDSATAASGGDLGWFRRGTINQDEVDRVAFSMQIGQVSQPVKAKDGYHIIRIDRLRPGEVRARDILIRLRMDARDIARAKLKAEKILDALKAGASYDSLADLYHDPGERPYLHTRKVGIALEALPAQYVAALDSVKPGGFSPVFDVVMPDGSMTKAGVMQLLTRSESGEYTLPELRERLRTQLSQAGSWHRLIDNLRKETYVSVRLDAPAAPVSK